VLQKTPKSALINFNLEDIKDLINSLESFANLFKSEYHLSIFSALYEAINFFHYLIDHSTSKK